MQSHRITRRNLLRTSAMAAGAAALPTASARAAQEGGTVRVYWHPAHDYEAYRAVIDQFTQDHPGWEVNVEHYQWPDMRTKILADFAAGNPPDLVAEPGGWVMEFALAGHLRSLQPYVDADGEAMGFPADWQPVTVERNTLDGEIYGVQIHFTCILLLYNKEMFAEAGVTSPPTTWEEFLDAAKATTHGNVFGFAPNQSTGYAWPWLLQNGVKYYDPQQQIVDLANDAAYEAMQFQADLIHEHKVAPVPIASADYEGPQKLFAARRAAMIVTGPWDVRPIREGSPDLDWGIAQALTRKVQATTAAGTSLMIPKQAKQPDLAWDLLKRFVAVDVEVAVTREADVTMPRKSWSEQPEIQQLAGIAPFATGLTYAQYVGADLDRTGKSGKIDDLFDLAYEEIIYRNRPATEVLAEFVEQANQILAG